MVRRGGLGGVSGTMAISKLFGFVCFLIGLFVLCQCITGDDLCTDSYPDDQSINSVETKRNHPNSCSEGSLFKCVSRRRRLRQVQQQLLSALNLSVQNDLADISTGEENPNDVQRWRNHGRNQAERVVSRTVESRRIIYATIGTRRRRHRSSPSRFYFNLTHVGPPHEIINATLFVYTRIPESASSSSGDNTDQFDFHMYVYSNETDVTAEPVISQTYEIDAQGSKWISTDLTQLTRFWAQWPGKNYGFLLKAQLGGEDLINRTMDEFRRTTDIFLDVTYRLDANPTVRYFLSAPTDERTMCQEGTEPTARCCRFPLIVDFEALGLDFIIAPKRYNAYYCAGDCSRSVAVERSKRTVPTSSSTPCCSPSQYQDIKILYINKKGGIEERIISDAIIQKCGCS